MDMDMDMDIDMDMDMKKKFNQLSVVARSLYYNL